MPSHHGVDFVQLQMQTGSTLFLRRLVKYGYSCSTTDFQAYLKLADQKLFRKMCVGEQHCLYQMLPALKAETSTYVLRKRKHPYVLPVFRYELFKKSFLMRCLYSSD